MAVKTDKRPEEGGVYDDGRPEWMEGISHDLATDEDLPPNHPSRSTAKQNQSQNDLNEDNLEDHESSAEQPASTNADQNEKEKNGVQDDTTDASWKTAVDKKKEVKGGFKVGTRGKVGAAVAAVVVSVAFALSGFVTGPLEFIHLSKLLQRHFASQENIGNGRILQEYKFARNLAKGNPERTRLGVLGNRIADKLDTKYKSIGVEKQFSGAVTGTYEGLTLDPVKFAENAQNGGDFQNLNKEEFQAKFKETYNVDLQLAPGDDSKFFAPADSGFFSYFRNRKLNVLINQEAGLQNLTGALSTRVAGKWDGATWHPISIIDSQLVGSADKRFTAFVKKQQERIQNGDNGDISTSGDTVKDDKGNTDQNATDKNASASDTTNKLTEDSKTTITDNPAATTEEASGIIKGITSSTGGKAAIGGTAAIGIACAVQAITKSAAARKHDLVVLPLIRIGIQAMALGDQTRDAFSTGGAGGVSFAQLGNFSRELNDPKTGSWAAARSIQAENGQPLTGPDFPANVKIDAAESGNMFLDLINGIPGLSTFCSATESGIGQAFTFVVSALTPVATIVTTAITSTSTFKDSIGWVVRWLSGSPIASVAFGATFGNYANYGARLASNDAAASTGGAVISPAQANAIHSYENHSIQEDNSEKTFAQRVFDPYSPDSLIGRVVDKSPTTVDGNIAAMTRMLSNPLKILSVFSLPYNKASAATSYGQYDYGFPKMGFSLEDMRSGDYENPYTNSDTVLSILAGSQGSTYITRAKNCFGATIDATGNFETDLTAKIDPTNKDYKSYNCADPSPDWTRVRFYVLDTKTAQAADCYLNNNDESCQQSGFGSTTGSTQPTATSASSSIVGDPFSSSVDVPCSTDTKDLGVVTGYNEGKAIQFRMCAVPNIPSSSSESTPGDPFYVNGAEGHVITNSRVSGAVFAMAAAANAAGVQLSAASSFRTMAHQQALFAANPDPKLVGPPGYSNHQAGAAIDFNIRSVHGGQTCAQRASAPGDPMWDWLKANSDKFGYKQYSAESWHFDPSPDSNRCSSTQ